MGRYITVAETAKLVRADLAKAFPGIKFSVRSKSYSGGASIDIHYTDGPTSQEVDRVAQRFSGATFDGMTDYKGGKEHEFNGEKVHFGADFIFVRRIYSADLLRRAVAFAQAKYADANLGTVTVKADSGFGAHVDASDYNAQRRIMEVASKMRANGCVVELKPIDLPGPKVIRTY
jgi:hypothetical protein